MCYCKNGVATLEKSIEDAKTKIPQLEADIKEAEAAKGQLLQDVEDAKKSRAEAKEAIQKATAIRDKEGKEFSAESAEMASNIDAMGRAIAAIEKGMAGSFLQTNPASVLRKLLAGNEHAISELSSFDRQVVTSFLSVNQGSGYAPASGEILGILKQMMDTMNADLKEATEAEAAAKAAFEELLAAKKKEIQACTNEIEDKLQRIGDTAVRVAEMKNDLEDTQESLAEDTKFLADLEKNCDAKKKEWAERQKLRSEELLALADVIKLLNDDDALELFKKALPSASALIQVDSTAAEVKSRALAFIETAQRTHRTGGVTLDLIALALKGKKAGFEKIIKLIDDMVVTLKKEQDDDTAKKEYCLEQFDTTEDKKKETERAISDLAAKMADTEEAIGTLEDEIKALQEGIFELDKQVISATETRKGENAAYSTMMAENNAAKEIIGIAKNRLNKFYNPKLYKPPPKRELTEEERITLNMGGTLAPTNMPGGIGGTGVTVLAQKDAPPPPPETFGAYKKKGEESSGVMRMMDMLVADLDKEMVEADAEEKDNQKDYEKFMNDSAAKRAADTKSVNEKEGAKADAEATLQAAKDEKKATETALMELNEVIRDLHQECDWLLDNFDLRKSARADEVDALKKAKAVLAGANYGPAAEAVEEA